jgi:hypothetical protein
MDKKEFERLTNDKNGMFKKWSDLTNGSAIARFMREGLDPYKKYTKKEITELCKEYKINLTDIIGIRKTNHSHSFGFILIKNDKIYKLHSKLIESFEKYF